MMQLDLTSPPFEALPSRTAFVERHERGEPQVVWTRLVADLETPVSAALKLSDGQPVSCLLESVEGGAVRGRYSIIGIAPDIVWRAFGNRAEINRRPQAEPTAFEADELPTLQSLRALLARSRIKLPPDLPPIAAGVIGYMGYDTVRLIEHLPNERPDALGVPDSVFVRPTVMVVFDAVKDEMIVVTPVYPQPSVGAQAAYTDAVERVRRVVAALDEPLPHATSMSGIALALPEPVSNTARDDYVSMVQHAKEYIAAGDIFQVVLSQRYCAPFTLASFSLYRALRRTNPSPFLFHLQFGDFALVGSSPEILVRVRDGEVTIRPLAGTRRRGATPEEDKALEAEMLADPKERAEHLMLLDLGRNDVGRVAEIGSVRVTESFAVERYSHVMHITSEVQGTLQKGLGPWDVMRATFPAGTLTGAPKVRAMQIIRELETRRRGAYGGAIGYVTRGNDLDLAIAIRTVVLAGDRFEVTAGAGIVADSVPESEALETRNKARAALAAIHAARSRRRRT